MFKAVLSQIKKWLPTIYGLVGAFVIAFGWVWYHYSHNPQNRFIAFILVGWIGVYVGYRVFKLAYGFLTAKFNRHVFWQKEFSKFLDSLFFVISLFFLVFFIQSELLSVSAALVLMAVLFWKTRTYLSGHPNAAEWKVVNRAIFSLIAFLFALFSIFQYAAYRLANFDAFIKFYDIVLFRAWAMTMLWVLVFVLATLFFWKTKNRSRYVFIGLWGGLFYALVVLWIINIGIMYFSGLYIGPSMLGLVKGSSGVVLNWLTALLVGGGLVVFTAFTLMFRGILRSYKQSSFRQWAYYSLVLIPIALFSIFGLSSFKTAPEYIIAKSFYNAAKGNDNKVELSPVIQAKLERFGLHYNTKNFNVAHKDLVFTPTTTTFLQTGLSKPNVIIIFLESFSARLTSVYNQNLPALTPGFETMAADPHTTVFKNYFNASTPTITGILSQMCSFLPPTGYTQIDKDRNLQNLRLLCLPKILKNSGGYKSTTYVEAVDKNFENKANIFPSMGTDKIYGLEELKPIIKNDPLSWGYSDHQTFPVMWNLAQKEQEPFLMMYSTIDTHPPFDIAKDIVPYKDGQDKVLNSFHTTDDAFAKFWQEFKQSKYYDNTIVVAVADHAAFPGAEIKTLFPKEANSLSFYDPNMFMMYVPGGKLPKEVNTFASGIDVAPTLLQILGINVPNSFEGHSIFDNRAKYPNLLGMHEFGLFINQTSTNKRDIRYELPANIDCGTNDYSTSSSSPLTLCEYLDFYKWKQQMFQQGRFWD